MVAAWIRAETGVGPSIASGSQVCRPICADLPIAPMNSSRQIVRHRVDIRHAEEVIVASALPRPRRRRSSSNCDRVEQQEDAEDAEREAEIADPVDHEGLDRRGVGRRPVVPEADQQIGAEPDPFPAEEQLHEIVGRHQHQHEEGEQAEIGEEARHCWVVAACSRWNRQCTIAETDGDDDQHHRGQLVDAQRPVDVEARPTSIQVKQLRSMRALPPTATSKNTIQPSSAARSAGAAGDDHATPGRRACRPNSPAMIAPSSGRKTIGDVHAVPSPSSC